MPILDDDDAPLTLPEAGRIRTGARSDQGAPRRLETFRLTSSSRELLEQAAQFYLGTVRPWSPGRGAAQKWELYTEAPELPLLIPPLDGVFEQWHELWTGRGCQRRCDGRQATLYGANGGREQRDCLCPADREQRAALAAQGKACRPVTRLRAILRGVPTTSLWRFETHSALAVREFRSQFRAFIEPLHAQGRTVPARLRLDQRERVKDGQRITFTVPILEVDAGAVFAVPEPEPLPALAAPDPNGDAAPVSGEPGRAPGGEPPVPGGPAVAGGNEETAGAAFLAERQEVAGYARSLAALAALNPRTVNAALLRVLGTRSLAEWFAAGGEVGTAKRALRTLSASVESGMSLAQAVKEQLEHRRVQQAARAG